MSDVNLSPNMGLPVPIVGVDPGPDWANNINSCMSILDQHNHSAGDGVQITPAGINISTDLGFNNNNATLLRSSRYFPQITPLSQPTDTGAVYVSGVDLYYNDVSGNQIRLTQGGSIVGTAGSISGLVAPASAFYSAGPSTFVWQSNVNTPANMDFASATFRNLVANSKGLTLQPPNAMGSDYTLTLPTLPASQKIMTLDNTGTMAAVYTIDNSSLTITANVIQVKAQGIQQAMLAPRSTGTTVGAGGVAVSASCGNYGQGSSTQTPVTNLSVTITTTGRPVMVFLQPDGSLTDSEIVVFSNTFGSPFANIFIKNGATEIFEHEVGAQYSPGVGVYVPVTVISGLDMTVNGSPGTYTYTIEAACVNNITQLFLRRAVLVAYEI